MVFRDPYILDFLNLSDSYSERDLETAILRDIEAFLLEMGGGFSFVTRQKRMVIDAVPWFFSRNAQVRGSSSNDHRLIFLNTCVVYAAARTSKSVMH
ncbi:MAG TPA: PDDEXK nuclease domain-containing protein [Edaphobacter sp.]|nr:PDDEXK nuclease domain-containing protein [Edaphobacter sp.]